MLALTIRQPFAWGICAGLKTIEWRARQTTCRHRIAIHAALPAATGWGLGDVFAPGKEQMIYGAIIGTVEITACQAIGQPLLWPTLGLRSIPGNHNPDPARWPFAWLLENGQFLPAPIPCRGKLGLWQLPAEIERQIGITW